MKVHVQCKNITIKLKNHAPTIRFQNHHNSGGEI